MGLRKRVERCGNYFSGVALKIGFLGALAFATSNGCIPSGCDPAPRLSKVFGPGNTSSPVGRSSRRNFVGTSEGAFNNIEGFDIRTGSDGITERRVVTFGFPPGVFNYDGTSVNGNVFGSDFGVDILPNGDRLSLDSGIVDIVFFGVDNPPVRYGIDLSSFRREDVGFGKSRASISVVSDNVFQGVGSLSVRALASDGKASNVLLYSDNVASSSAGVPPGFPAEDVPNFPTDGGGEVSSTASLLEEICRQGTQGRNVPQSPDPSLDTRVYVVTSFAGQFFYRESPEEVINGIPTHTVFLASNEMAVAVSGGGYARAGVVGGPEVLHASGNGFSFVPPVECNHDVLPLPVFSGRFDVISEGPLRSDPSVIGRRVETVDISLRE